MLGPRRPGSQCKQPFRAMFERPVRHQADPGHSAGVHHFEGCRAEDRIASLDPGRRLQLRERRPVLDWKLQQRLQLRRRCRLQDLRNEYRGQRRERRCGGLHDLHELQSDTRWQQTTKWRGHPRLSVRIRQLRQSIGLGLWLGRMRIRRLWIRRLWRRRPARRAPPPLSSLFAKKLTGLCTEICVT